MESGRENLCSVIQYYKGPDTSTKSADVAIADAFDIQNSVEENINENVTQNILDNKTLPETNHDHQTDEVFGGKILKAENVNGKVEGLDLTGNENGINREGIKEKSEEHVCASDGLKVGKAEACLDANEEVKAEVPEVVKPECDLTNTDITKIKSETKDEDLKTTENENELSVKGKKRTLSEVNADSESVTPSGASAEEAEANEDGLESDFNDDGEDNEEGAGNKPRKRGRCKKNPDIIPSHLSSDMVLGYKILLKFLETPQFAGFHKPFKKSTENCKITSLNQIKKKFEENSYKKVSEFVNDVREMLINIYESRNQVAIKKALRLEQILEQRIAQLPNYLRPQCALMLSSDEANNCHNKIRITKGGGFVSLLLEKTEKKRYEKNREKRKLLAEERKQLKEEQDKDVQEWERNVLMKNFEEDIKSMWELPAIGHFIHLCADIFNIGEVAQFEVERMLLMPQCSDTLDLIMTALLTNSLMRAKLDRTPSMPYSIWGPLVRTRVVSWYRMWHRDGRNDQKVFEEIGIEPDFWQILGPDNPLDYYYFHEVNLMQRVWILKTLCDVDFVKKKTVYDNIRAQTLDELNPIHLGLDQQGNRYIQFKQFCGSDIRIYRQNTKLEGDITPSELIESTEGFECREGPIGVEKVFKDIWELSEKPGTKIKKKKPGKTKKVKNFSVRIKKVEPSEKRNLRQSAREKQKAYVDWSDSDQSDTDLRTLRNKLLKSDNGSLYRPFSNKEFISLSVFRLPREKVNKPTPKKSSHASRKTEDSSRNDVDKSSKTESEDRKEDIKPSACEDEQSDSFDTKQIPNTPLEFEKNFHGDDMNEDEFDLREKISNNCELENSDVKFTVKNLEDLKMVFTKGSSIGDDESEENISGDLENSKSEENKSTREKEYDALYKYNVPNHLKPDSNKFYLVVDSVEGLRQLISKFGSHENDLEIITRSTKSKKKLNCNSSTSSEVQLIERLQNLLLELEPWELDLMKSSRANKEKMYKEYMNFLNRPPDFVHPNESYWMKTYEEPNSTTTTTTTTTTTVTTTEANSSNVDKGIKEGCATTGETTDVSQQDTSSDTIGLRKRTRVTRVQLQPQTDDLDEDFDDGDDYESNESDDNWVLPTPKKRSKKETTTRTPKLPRRSIGRKSKSSPLEKTETSVGEKSQGSSPEKAKKALFWGPRSSDPSEDLNWETNRQKILEQHNSPIKKVLKTDETNDLSELESSPNFESGAQSSPKRLTPGNKKPYFSPVHLKALEGQAKKDKTAETQYLGAKTSTSKQGIKTTKNSNSSVLGERNKTAAKIQTYSRVRKAGAAQSGVSSSQTVNKLGKTPIKQGGTTTVNSQVVRYGSQICSVTPGDGTDQKFVGAIQIQQSCARVQPVQIQDFDQNKVITSAANVKVGSQQAVQWQQKVINVQTVNQSRKIIQQQVQTTPSETQNLIQPQGQYINKTQVHVQGQGQQVTFLEPQKLSAIQQPPEKVGNFLQMVTPQGQTANLNFDSDLFITDGKNIIKFDSNFVHQLQNDKVVNLDLKKTLLLVKPKVDSNVNTNQGQNPTSQNQQSVFVINKPAGVQQTVGGSVPSFVIPTNYLIKESNQQAQGEQGQQTVKIIQQAPAYVIQQKPVLNKSLQPQVIKIITSQPMGSNQNLILAPVAGQVIQSVPQTIGNSEQQTNKSPATIRLMRPQIATSVASNSAQNKVSPMQSPVIVNNMVNIVNNIQNQKFEGSRPPTAVVTGKIVSTGVPAVRMATPQTVLQSQSAQPASHSKSVLSAHSETQTVVTNLPQGIRANVITQPVRLATVAQGEVQSSVASANCSPRFVVSTTPGVRLATSAQSQLQTSSSTNQTQPVKFSTSPHQIATSVSSQIVKPVGFNTQQVRLAAAQPHTVIQTTNVNPQVLGPSTTLSTQAVRLVSQPQFVQTQAIVASTNPTSQVGGSSGNLGTQSMKIVQPQQYQTQTVVPCVNLNSQTVRLATNMNSQPIRFMQSQPVRLIANNNVGVKLVNRNPASVKTAVITNTGETQTVGVSNITPSGVVRYQTIVQPSGVRPVQNRLQLATIKKTVNANTLENSSVAIVEDEDEVRILGENVTENPVTLDYINGELSVKKTSQGWKYAVKASNGKDIILTDEQIEERLKANNGVMK